MGSVGIDVIDAMPLPYFRAVPVEYSTKTLLPTRNDEMAWDGT